MSSLIPDYEYDIFISYRHNDNLPNRQAGRSGWVAEFVNALRIELAAKKTIWTNRQWQYNDFLYIEYLSCGQLEISQ